MPLQRRQPFIKGFSLFCLLWLLAFTARAELQITGLKDDVEKQLRLALPLEQIPCQAPTWWLRRHLREQPELVRRALEIQGYYNTEIHQELVAESKRCWVVKLDIDPGPRARYRKIHITTNLPEQALLQANTEAKLDLPKKGDAFSHPSYEELKERWLETLKDKGYLDARWSRHEVRIDAEQNAADVDLQLDAGTQYRISPLRIHQSALDESLVLSYLGIREGEVFDRDDLSDAYRRLLETGYFDDVQFQVQTEERNGGAVPLDVDLVAADKRTYEVGAGFATDTGPRARADAHFRRINPAGHRASVGALWSEVEGKISGEYRIPDPKEPRLGWYAVEAGYDYSNTDTFESELWHLDLRRSREYDSRWIRSDYVSYSDDSWQIGEQTGNSQLILFGNGWDHRSLVSDPRPVSGHSVSLGWRFGLSALGSDTDVLQLNASGKQILPLTKNLRLLARAQAGWNFQRKFDELPPSLRFFAGGDTSVRGYGLDEIGEVDNGEVVGGRGLLVGSLELDLRVREHWSVAMFADSGSAFDNSPEFSSGVGVGVRWYSPVGPLRLDLAHPLDDPSRTVRLHVSLGVDL